MWDFLNATLVLDESCNKSPSSLAHKNLALLVDNETTSIFDDEQRLICTRTTLLKLRNRYAVPVSVLPPEVLALVFSMAVGDKTSACYRVDTPTILSSVCNSWRQIATNMRTLWRHVVFNQNICSFQGMMQRSALWLERSQGALLDVEFGNLWKEKYQLTEYDFQECLEEVSFHMESLRSLKLEQHNADSIRLALLTWVENGTPGSLTELSIDAKVETHEWTPEYLPDVDQISEESLSSFLRLIEYLGLRNAYLDWDCAAFTGLLELELRNLDPDVCPTITQLTNALAASPMLHTLTLHLMGIGSSDVANITPI